MTSVIRRSASESAGDDAARNSRGTSAAGAGAGAGGFSGSGGGVRFTGGAGDATFGAVAGSASATGDDTSGSSSTGEKTRDGGGGVASGGPFDTVWARAFAQPAAPAAKAAAKAHCATPDAQRRLTIDDRWLRRMIKSHSHAGARRGTSSRAPELTVPPLHRRASG